eukprot:11336347-Prorocentrum_lima.AAC.1
MRKQPQRHQHRKDFIRQVRTCDACVPKELGPGEPQHGCIGDGCRNSSAPEACRFITKVQPSMRRVLASMQRGE